jgi:hypothetical protein
MSLAYRVGRAASGQIVDEAPTLQVAEFKLRKRDAKRNCLPNRPVGRNNVADLRH